MLISFWSVDKHGHQFLFLVDQFLKISSPLKPLGWMNWKLVGSICGRSSVKIAHFVPIPLTKMATIANSCFWLVDFLKSFTLKPLVQIKHNFTWSIYGRLSIRFPHFITIGQNFMVTIGNSCFWLVEIKKIFSSETRRHNE